MRSSPTRAAFLEEERTANTTLQRYNELNVANHRDIYNDPDAQKLVFNVLFRLGTTRPERVF